MKNVDSNIGKGRVIFDRRIRKVNEEKFYDWDKKLGVMRYYLGLFLHNYTLRNNVGH
jgi:hypothetical protein